MAKDKRPTADRLRLVAPGFGQRVRAAARLIGTYQEAAEAMDLVYDQLRKIMDEKAVPNFPSIVALSQRSGFSLTWLASGRGPQFANESLSTEKSLGGAVGTAAEQFENPDVVLVRRYDLRAAAGHGANVDAEHVAAAVPFSRRYLEVELRCSIEDVAMIENNGDSMLPTIRDRDLLMVHLRRREIASGHIYVFRIGNELLVKRAQREVDGSVSLISDNSVYRPYRLTQAEADQVAVIGRMIWKGGAV